MENLKNIDSVKVDKTKIINLERGMLPPQAIELEEAVLGAMISFKPAVDDAMAVISSPEIFYKEPNKYIFEAIQQLYNAGNPVDLLTVSSQLRTNAKLELVGGDYYLIQLSQKVSSSAHVDYHCRIIIQKFMARKTIMFSNMIISMAYDETTDVFELMQRWQKEFDNVMDFINTGRSTMDFPSALNNLIHEVELLTKNKDEVKLVGIDTGFKRLNKYTGGYRNQDLIIIAARPGMGKTSYVLKLAVENCKKDVGVGFISLEMSMQQLTARMVGIDTNFHLKQLIKTGFEHDSYFETYRNHQSRMNKYPFYVDDSGKTDVTDIVITAKLWKRKYDIGVLVIDYIQLITDRSVKGNREAEVSAISRRLKRLAKELDIPVIVLSQLSRECEKRGSSKRPLLSDLRDSGSIEQDADMVQFLYRPEYYKIDMDYEDYNADVHHLIDRGANSEVIIAKYRSGSLNTTLLRWVGDKTKFIDVEDDLDVAGYESNIIPLGDPSVAFDDVDDKPF